MTYRVIDVEDAHRAVVLPEPRRGTELTITPSVPTVVGGMLVEPGWSARCVTQRVDLGDDIYIYVWSIRRFPADRGDTERDRE